MESTARWHSPIVILLTVLSLFAAWASMAAISRKDPWYRNTDMNIHNMVDALALNSGIAPNPFAQPGVPLKYLLALDYRLRNAVGMLPVWTMKRFGRSADPLTEIPPLIRIARVHSRILTICTILAAGGLMYSVTRNVDAACLSIILLCGCAGLLFQGLLSRPELLCVGFGNILALWFTWRGTSVRHWPSKHTWLFLAGVMGGLATLEKLPGVCYIALCYGWCWLSAWTSRDMPSAPTSTAGPSAYWSGLLPAIGAASALWLLWQMKLRHDDLGTVVLLRLRAAAVFISLLPLLILWNPQHRFTRFLVERMRELALLGGGALFALTLSYLLLRGIMEQPAAVSYMTGVLHFLVNPAPYLKDFLGPEQAVHTALLASLKDTPFLFVSSVLVAIGVWFLRSTPLQLKAFLTLLLAGGLALTYLMSKRYFSAQYSIFPQVPLLLVWALGLYAVFREWKTGTDETCIHWGIPLTFCAAFIFMLTGYLRVQPRYYFFQNDVSVPVNQLTLTFLFDHDAHVHAYRDIMQKHYGDREAFAQRLDQYLSDPHNRY